MSCRLLLATALLGACGGVQAFDYSGTQTVVAVTRDGARTAIGRVEFTPQPQGGAAFKVSVDPAVMRDHFLSMREFKCLPAEVEISCFVPYPYASPARVAPGDLAWLEHHLLFFFKQPRDYGAKLWNGMVFKLREEGAALVGEPQAIDLNRLGVPPERPDVPLYGAADRDDFAPGARWVTQIRIEPVR